MFIGLSKRVINDRRIKKKYKTSTDKGSVTAKENITHMGRKKNLVKEFSDMADDIDIE